MHFLQAWFFFFSSRRRHTRFKCDWSSDVCSSDLLALNFKAKGGAYTRENFFGKYPELKEMVANMSDDDIWRLNRGGHDARKVFAAYSAAMNHKGQPTVILAKTVKGFGLGKAAEGQMVAHQQKKLDES